MKVCLVQFVGFPSRPEWGIDYGWAPNIGLSLIASDLNRSGHKCDTVLVFKSNKLPKKFLSFLRKNNYSLIGLHSGGFIYDKIAENFLISIKKASSDSKIVVGGPDSIFFMNDQNVDYVVMGPGRESLQKLVWCLESKSDLKSVPNLFFKVKKNNNTIIDFSSKHIEYDIKREILKDYYPRKNWFFFGYNYRPVFHQAVIVGRLGCLYDRSTHLNPYYKNMSFEEHHVSSFFRYELSQDALKRLMDYYSKITKGCTFCSTKADKGFVFLNKEETMNSILFQIEYWLKNSNISIFHFIEENPLAYLYDIIKKMKKGDRGSITLEFDMRADYLARGEKELMKALKLAEKKNIIIQFVSIGFENFVQRHLDIYNKGTKVEDNIETIRLCKSASVRYPKNFRYESDVHGLILFNPWITLEELETNVKIMKKNSFWLFPSYNLGHSRLRVLKNNMSYLKTLNDGLTKSSNNYYCKVDWRFIDWKVKLVYDILMKNEKSKLKKVKRVADWQSIVKKELDLVEELIDYIKTHQNMFRPIIKLKCYQILKRYDQ